MRGGAGHWHELAKMLPVLDAAGYNGLMVEQEAGVERATQNRWTVSMHVSLPPGSRLMPLLASCGHFVCVLCSMFDCYAAKPRPPTIASLAIRKCTLNIMHMRSRLG